MRFVELWQMQNQKFYVLFEAPVLKTFDTYRQKGRFATEAGGVLFGYVRGGHLQIVQASKPQPGDVRCRMRYERNDRAHQIMADQLWSESFGEVRYLGEWHTHPEDRPSPSGVDIDGWRHRASERQDARATLGVIVGRDFLYVSLVDKKGNIEVCNAQEIVSKPF